MLSIELKAARGFNNQTQEFIYYPSARLLLEHSLRSISKWEGITHKSFFREEPMTADELLCYIRCMTTNPQKDPEVYDRLSLPDVEKILKYINDPHTAKSFPPERKRARMKTEQTSEDYYSAMAYYGIPFECENWHFGRLAALIKTCEKQMSPGEPGGKKMSFRETQMFYDQINEARLKKLGTKG